MFLIADSSGRKAGIDNFQNGGNVSASSTNPTSSKGPVTLCGWYFESGMAKDDMRVSQ